MDIYFKTLLIVRKILFTIFYSNDCNFPLYIIVKLHLFLILHDDSSFTEKTVNQNHIFLHAKASKSNAEKKIHNVVRNVRAKDRFWLKLKAEAEC